MANINRTQGSGNQNFKQIEGDGWLSTYLPAICAGTVMAVVLLLAMSCSNKSSKPAAKISAPTTTAANAAHNAIATRNTARRDMALRNTRTRETRILIFMEEWQAWARQPWMGYASRFQTR